MTDEPTRLTPRMEDGGRVEMPISAEDARQIKRGELWEGNFTDLQTGTTHYMKAAECSLPGCLCDALVVGARMQ